MGIIHFLKFPGPSVRVRPFTNEKRHLPVLPGRCRVRVSIIGGSILSQNSVVKTIPP